MAGECFLSFLAIAHRLASPMRFTKFHPCAGSKNYTQIAYSSRTSDGRTHEIDTDAGGKLFTFSLKPTSMSCVLSAFTFRSLLRNIFFSQGLSKWGGKDWVPKLCPMKGSLKLCPSRRAGENYSHEDLYMSSDVFSCIHIHIHIHIRVLNTSRALAILHS